MNKLKEFIKWNLPLAVMLAVILLSCINADAGSDYTEPQKIRTTCYTWTGNRCANGDYPTQGLTVAWKRECIGWTIVLYDVAEDGSCGDIIGIYEVEDTGGSYIRSGQRIDVFRYGQADVTEWIREHGDYCYYQAFPSEG